MARYQEIRNIENYDKIARKLDSAERLMESDPDMAITAMRTASELMLKQLCVKYTGSEGEDNSERINTLETQGVIDSSICRSLHRIRLTANDSLHEGYEVADYDAGTWYDVVLTLASTFVNEVDPDGTVNRDASRRVEFKFRLKDSEMIQEMNRILTQMEAQNSL